MYHTDFVVSLGVMHYVAKVFSMHANFENPYLSFKSSHILLQLSSQKCSYSQSLMYSSKCRVTKDPHLTKYRINVTSHFFPQFVLCIHGDQTCYFSSLPPKTILAFSLLIPFKFFYRKSHKDCLLSLFKKNYTHSKRN